MEINYETQQTLVPGSTPIGLVFNLSNKHLTLETNDCIYVSLDKSLPLSDLRITSIKFEYLDEYSNRYKVDIPRSYQLYGNAILILAVGKHHNCITLPDKLIPIKIEVFIGWNTWKESEIRFIEFKDNIGLKIMGPNI